MPKVVLEFSLPEEETELTLALKARLMHLLISETDRKLRDKLKYAELSDETRAVLKELRDELRSTCNDDLIPLE